MNVYTTTETVSDSLEVYLTYKEEFIAFTNAILIDGTGTAAKTNQTLLIESDIIKAVEKGQ